MGINKRVTSEVETIKMTSFSLPFEDKKIWDYLRLNSYLSVRHKLFYVATPKAACTSLKWWFAALEGYSRLLSEITDSAESDPDLVIHDSFHRVAPTVTGLTPEILAEPITSDSYFRFAVVRNPYKRLFSAWQSKLLLREPLQVRPYLRCDFLWRPIEGPADIALAFEGFIKHLASREAPDYWDYHWTPQVTLLRPDVIAYTKLTQIEDVKELSLTLSEHLGAHILDPLSSHRTNESLIPYSPNFITGQAAALIRSLYAEDFETFGYAKQLPEAKEEFSSAQLDVALQAIHLIRGRHQRLAEIRDALSGQITSLQEGVVERDGQIVGLRQDVVEHRGQITSLCEAVAERDGQIVTLQQDVVERDGQITSLCEGVAERDGQIVTLQEGVAERDGQITSLQEAVAERDGHIESLRQGVAERDVQIESLNQAIGVRDKQVADLKHCEADLAMLHATKLMRLRDTMIMDPWGFRKVGRIGYLLVSLATPRYVKRMLAILVRKPPSRPKVAEQVSHGHCFNRELYLNLYPDVAAAGIDPYQHYVRHGKAEGRIGQVPDVEVRGEDVLEATRETVLVVSHEGSRTGAPILSYNLVRELLKKYNVVALFLGAGGPMLEECLAGGAVVIGPIPGPWRGPLPEFVAGQIVDQFSIQFAIVNSIESRFVLPALARRYVPSITLIHEFAAYTRPHGAFMEAVCWSGETVFSSRITRDNAWSEYKDLEEKDFLVIPQGRCVMPGEADEQKMVAEREVICRIMRPEGFSDDGVVVLGAGTVQLRKGVDLFIDCAAQVRRHAPDLSFRFVWIGKGYDPERDGAYSVYLADQIRRSDLEKHVFFLDEVSNLATAYEVADLLLVSSRLDPLPNVAIDALAEGLPVVCFDKTTGIADILNELGLAEPCVAAYLDTGCMARKVIALAKSVELRKHVGSQSAEAAANVFDMPRYVTQLEELATQGVEDAQQEMRDAQTIAESELIRLDYFLPLQLQRQSREEAIRRYVRLWATGVGQRKMFPGFHPGVYLEQHGVAKPGADPLADYLRAGQPQGPWNFDLITSEEQPKPVAPKLRVGLHIHAYYTDLFPEMVKRIKLNRNRPDLLISVKSEEDRDVIAAHMNTYKGGAVNIRVVPNRGRDIGPFLTEFGEIIRNNYDLIGHVHTKKSADLKDEAFGKTWYLFLLENLLGGKVPMADMILGNMSEDPSIGMVFPDDPYVIGWTKNPHYVKEMNSQLALDSLPENFVFPVGTMFWANVSFLDKIFNMGLKWESYPEEPLPYDGSLLHALERLLPFIVQNAGGLLRLTNVQGVTR